MAITSSHRFRRKPPIALLFAQQQQEQQRTRRFSLQSATSTKKSNNNNKKKNTKFSSFKVILLFGLTIIGIQITLLRSVSIRDQIIHDSSSSTTTAIRQSKLGSSSSSASNTASIISKSSEEYHMLYDEPIILSDFPKWIQEYVTWHQQVREEFPDMELFNNPNAPHILVRTCLGLCGGLHDRIGQLPWDLYLAYKTKRILLLAWQRPQSLENFLIPSSTTTTSSSTSSSGIVFNWTVPYGAKFGFHDMKLVRNITQLFEGYKEDGPDDTFFNKQVDEALDRATGNGSFANIHILRHRILGHLGEEELDKRLQLLDDEKSSSSSSSIHTSPLFGKIFWLFFKPSQPVHDKTIQIMKELNLIPGSYTAVHCRVRHPKAFKYGTVVSGKNPKYPVSKKNIYIPI